MNFKVGNVVICIFIEMGGINLKKGEFYTITKTFSYRNMDLIELKELPNFGYYVRQFQLAPKKYQRKTEGFNKELENMINS